MPPLRAIYHSISLVRRILMRPLRTLADAWLVRYPSFSFTESYSYSTATSHTPTDSSRPADSIETLPDGIRPPLVELPQLSVSFPRAVITLADLPLLPAWTLLRVLLVYTTRLYIVLFYSLNKAILLSDPLVTLVLSVKCPTSTKFPPESM